MTTNYWTTEDIRDEMNRAGSHWWDKESMRFFGTRISTKLYQGDGGIYFVTSEQPPHGARKYSVRQYHPETTTIKTVGEFCQLSRSQACSLARRSADGISEVAQ